MRRGPLVADAVVGLADVRAGLVAVHGLDDQRVGPALLLAARQQVVLQTERYPQLPQVLQSRPLVWSTDVRSTRLYGQFLASPERNEHFVSVKACLKVQKTRLYGQNLGQKAHI